MSSRKLGAAANRGRGGRLFLTVVVPCYNEEAVIRNSYRRLRATCESLAADYEIILGNDGSSDGTLEILKEIAANDGRVIVTSHHPNRGAGYTYREMYAAAGGDIVIQADADLAMPPEVALPALLAALADADVAMGSRYVGVKAEYPLKRKLFSRGYILLNRILFKLDVKDTQTGSMAFYRNMLPSLDLQADGFEMLLEFVVQAEAAGLKVAEVGLPWRHDTTSGETDVWRETARMLAGTIRLRRRLGRRPRPNRTEPGDGGNKERRGVSA